jgi:Ferric uptake regulator family
MGQRSVRVCNEKIRPAHNEIEVPERLTTLSMAQKHDRLTAQPHQHDHRSCMSGVEARADAGFTARGMKMTPLRRQVLATIASSHDAVGAYEVVERIAKKGGRRLAPVSVYRIIDSLMDIGVVHKLESRQAYYACHGDHAEPARMSPKLTAKTS